MIVLVRFLFSFTYARSFQCMHDQFPKPIEMKEGNDSGRQLFSLSWMNASEGGSFRVFFETHYLEQLTSGISCRSESDLVFHSGSYWPCRSVDIFTDQQKQAVLDTLTNIKTFIFNTMKVIPIETLISGGRFGLSSTDDTHYPVLSGESDGRTDLYIMIYPRPFGVERILASGGVVPSSINVWGRPIQGYIDMNMAYAPTVSQSIDTEGDREFFDVVLHELLHILGISGDLFSKWINPNTGQAYGSNLPLYTIPAGAGHVNKTFTILHTPNIHSVLSERWGYEYFNNNRSWPVGVELENSGSLGTISSHWEGRTHYTDSMTAKFFGYSYLSKLSFAALEDTGWYSVDMTRAEPIAWGDWRSIEGASSSDFRNFALGAPAVSWPTHYVPRTATEMENMDCTFDHKAVFSGNGFSRRSCNGRTTSECEYPEFYDATNIGYYGNSSLDYSLIAYPIRICANIEDYNSSTHAGSFYGTNSMCARTKLSEGTNPTKSSYIGECYKMECPGDGILRILIGSNNRYVNCTEALQRKTVSGYTGDLECPDPGIVCGIKRFEQGLSNELDRTRTQSPRTQTPGTQTPRTPTPRTPTPRTPTPRSAVPGTPATQSALSRSPSGSSILSEVVGHDAGGGSAASALPVFLIPVMVVVWVLVLIVGTIVIALVVRRRMKKRNFPSALSEASGIETEQKSITAVDLSGSAVSRNFSLGQGSRGPERISVPGGSLDSDENDNRRSHWSAPYPECQSTERASSHAENWSTQNLFSPEQNRPDDMSSPYPENSGPWNPISRPQDWSTENHSPNPQNRSAQRVSPGPEDQLGSPDPDQPLSSTATIFY